MANYYKISEENVVELANEARRLGNVENELTFAQIKEILKNTEPGGPMFETTALGVIPDVPKGYANSTFMIDFETNASGSLS